MLVLRPWDKRTKLHFWGETLSNLTLHRHPLGVILMATDKIHFSYFYFLKHPQLDTKVSAGNGELKERIDIANSS